MEFGELLDKLVGLQHTVAVYEEVISHLQDFLSNDTDDAEYQIEAEDCFVPLVTADVVEAVQHMLEEQQGAIKQEILALKSVQVAAPVADKTPKIVKTANTAKNKKTASKAKGMTDEQA